MSVHQPTVVPCVAAGSYRIIPKKHLEKKGTEVKEMRIVRTLMFCAAVAATACVTHAVGIAVSAPVQYDATHYYAYGSSTPGTWDQVAALVSILPTYNGLTARLATFPTEDQYNWFVAHESDFVNPSAGEWDIAWIGACNTGGGTYEWLDGQGEILSTNSHWGTGQPVAANYGVSWNLSGYGDVWVSRPADDTSIGNVIVEYAPVPEPATMSLLALAGLAMLRRRK